MFGLAWVAALGLLTLFFDGQLEQQYNPNQQPSSFSNQIGAEVRLKRNKMGHYVTAGTINNEPVVFLLDTGATSVSIPAELGQRLGLYGGYAQQVMTANGTVTVASTQISQLEIGEIKLQDVPANLNPGMRGNEILLGMSALKQLEFSQRGDWLILNQRY